MAGGLAGVNSWVITYPADVVKKKCFLSILFPKIYNLLFISNPIKCEYKSDF